MYATHERITLAFLCGGSQRDTPHIRASLWDAERVSAAHIEALVTFPDKTEWPLPIIAQP